MSNSNLKTQKHVENINRLTKKQQMIKSEKKTKSIIVNCSKSYQLHTRILLNNQNIEIVNKMKILGTIFTKNISWNENCAVLIKIVNASN